MTDIDWTQGCIVVGGGPAGLVLGLLLARGGVRTTVLEKHPDFLRDFRGDTIHPATQDLLADLGLLPQFLARPHDDLAQVTIGWRGREEFAVADFDRLPTRRRCVSFMPQWDFLDLIAGAAEALPTFRLLRATSVHTLCREDDRVSGVRAIGPDGPLELQARLVVAADGRNSTVREQAGLPGRQLSSAMDVLWLRVPRPLDVRLPLMQAGDGIVISIDRGNYLQLAFVVEAGSWSGSAADWERARRRIAAVVPALTEELAVLDQDQVHLLQVRMDRLRRWWQPGLLCIGDAAHAMSPAGGVGINLAIQDAVATANLLGPVLLDRVPSVADLARVQRRRARPAAAVQSIQHRLQGWLLATDRERVPVPLRVLDRSRLLRHLAGRVLGLGLRPERIGWPA